MPSLDSVAFALTTRRPGLRAGDHGDHGDLGTSRRRRRITRRALRVIARLTPGHRVALVTVAVIDALVGIGHAFAVLVLMLPAIARRRRVAVVKRGRLDDAHVAVAPIVVTEEKPVSNHDGGTPEKSAVAGVIAITRPRRPAHGLVVRPPPAAIDHHRVVVRDVHHIRVAVAHDDRALLPDHPHMFGFLEVARLVGTLAQGLDRLHDLLLLGEEGIPQAARPLKVLVHPGQYLRERQHRLDAGIPGLFFGGTHGVLALQLGTRAGKARRLHHLERISGGHQELRQQLVGIQGHGGQHLVEFCLGEQRDIRRCRLLGQRERGKTQGKNRQQPQNKLGHGFFLAGRRAGPTMKNGTGPAPLTGVDRSAPGFLLRGLVSIPRAPRWLAPRPVRRSGPRYGHAAI